MNTSAHHVLNRNAYDLLVGERDGTSAPNVLSFASKEDAEASFKNLNASSAFAAVRLYKEGVVK